MLALERVIAVIFLRRVLLPLGQLLVQPMVLQEVKLGLQPGLLAFLNRFRLEVRHNPIYHSEQSPLFVMAEAVTPADL